jgi:hypothetical protein
MDALVVPVYLTNVQLGSHNDIFIVNTSNSHGIIFQVLLMLLTLAHEMHIIACNHSPFTKFVSSRQVVHALCPIRKSKRPYLCFGAYYYVSPTLYTLLLCTCPHKDVTCPHESLHSRVFATM